MAVTKIRKHSVRPAGRRTSVSMEDEFWDEFRAICGRDGVSMDSVIARLGKGRSAVNMSSAVRLYVLGRVMQRAQSAEDTVVRMEMAL